MGSRIILILAVLMLVLPNGLLLAQGTPDDPQYAEQWYLERINVEEAWQETTGSPSVIVAVLDSGVDAGHEDMEGILLPGWDCVNDDDTPEAFLGHGTERMGVMG